MEKIEYTEKQIRVVYNRKGNKEIEYRFLRHDQEGRLCIKKVSPRIWKYSNLEDISTINEKIEIAKMFLSKLPCNKRVDFNVKCKIEDKKLATHLDELARDFGLLPMYN